MNRTDQNVRLILLDCRLDKIQGIAVRNMDDCVAVLERLHDTADEAFCAFWGVVYCYESVGPGWLGHCGVLEVAKECSSDGVPNCSMQVLR